MAESVGGFYASLKLNTDTASFKQGLATLKQFKNEIQGIANIQRLLNRLYGQNDGGVGASRSRGTVFSNGDRILKKYQQQMINGEKNADRIQQAEQKRQAKAAADLEKEKKRQQDETATATKWMLGAAVAATAAFVKLGAAISDAWSGNQSVTQSAALLLLDPVWLKKRNAEANIAGAKEGSVEGAVGKLNSMIANPEMGKVNKELITTISGILGAGSNTDLGYAKLKGLSSGDRFDAVMQALQEMFRKGGSFAVNAGDIAEQLGVKDILGYRLNPAYLGGGDSVLQNGEDIAMSNEAAIRTKKLMADLNGAWELFASNMAELLLPVLKGMNDWFRDNRTTIKGTINAIPTAVKIAGDVGTKAVGIATNPVGAAIDAGKELWKSVGWVVAPPDAPKVKSAPDSFSPGNNIVIYATIDGKNIPMRLSRIESQRDFSQKIAQSWGDK